MRSAGIRGDRSQMPAILAALDPEKGAWFNHTALRALSELGTTAELPALDTLIASTKIKNTVYFAQSVRARIVAREAAMPTANAANKGTKVPRFNTPQQKAQFVLNRFFKELNLTADRLNQSTQARAKQAASKLATAAPGSERDSWALDELADMIYYGDAKVYLSLPDVARLDFSQNYGAALKMKVAAMSHEARVKWLIDDMAGKKSLKWQDDYEIQLAIDEGLPASHAAAAKLHELDKARDAFVDVGFLAEFRILSGVGDKDDMRMISYFAQDEDKDVRSYSVFYPHFKRQAMGAY